ncbi:Low temperature requirement protein LtrA [Propionibacterium cyclohexanicum]|uniref:Low temperature requirement protein LtrA n=1 Tax=Propionibacterium cyclohexanicum TaxID=64702 RepID=A0A1H9REK7_9ACTN|nr:low temperature requirement protein A [Propionibacterium cyclohexanicum]SER71281.1 Low temperature requirement protein LtrA [Propionibacterium cyclohexanicum]
MTTAPRTKSPTNRPRLLLQPMRPRDPDEPHRAASPLELFFDLVFVVAVSLSSQTLHHIESEGHVAAGALSYLMVFFAIWWAWMNFTWFATSFAVDDWLYRIMTILQMGGVLVLAAGAQSAMAHHDFTLVTFGYVIMRLALVGQWLRASHGDPALRGTARRYALGIAVVQAAWIGRLACPPAVGFAVFFVLAAAEVLVPVWAERRGNTAWNARHITERYGLFTLILLGESILAATNAVVEALNEGHSLPRLLAISAGGLATAAGMWWVYFATEHELGDGLRGSLLFGYFHYVIFAAAGAFSAGIEVAIDAADDRTHLSAPVAAGTLTVPVALFIASVWWLTLRRGLNRTGSALVIAGVLVIAAATVIPSAPIPGTTLGVTLAVLACEMCRRPAP